MRCRIARAPDDDLYRATWDSVPLPGSRHQPFDAPGRPIAHLYYQQSIDLLVGAWPDEDRRWRDAAQLLLQRHPRLRPARWSA